ncbi:MAG: cytochrome c biogenesis heme-transporting ATPase CcmA [Gammaproteobacteria bacterium]
MSAKLIAKSLEYSRNDHVLFSNLDFEVNSGEVLQIEGSNGSGKTTLLRILCGLIKADLGQIFWSDQDIQKDRYDYSVNTSYVGHHDGLKGDCTPLENLSLSAALFGSKKNKQDSLSPQEAIKKVGLGGFEYQLCRTLSAGQRRRVALARLLISPTKLWILDEPFTAIDKSGIGELTGIIADHANSDGMVILTSHHDVDLPEVKKISLEVERQL